MAAPILYSYEARDGAGGVLRPNFYSPSPALSRAVLTALGQWSLAGMQAAKYVTADTAWTTTTPGAGAQVSTGAKLTFSTAQGGLVVVTIPCVKTGVGNPFLPDGETVSPTSILALINACLAGVVDAAGNAVTAYISGVRAQYPRRPVGY